MKCFVAKVRMHRPTLQHAGVGRSVGNRYIRLIKFTFLKYVYQTEMIKTKDRKPTDGVCYISFIANSSWLAIYFVNTHIGACASLRAHILA